MRPIRVIPFAISLAALGGCTAILGDFTATTGDGGADAASRDAAVDARDGGTSSRRHDASTRSDAHGEDATPGSDGARRTDAGPDAPSPHDGGAQDAGNVDAGHVGATDAGAGIATEGTPCSSPGTYACTGHNAAGVLVCTNGSWAFAASSPCPGGENCDSRHGNCAPIVAACANLEPGQTFCSDGGTVAECGINLVTTSVKQACSAHQSCTEAGGSATCTCNTDPTCGVEGTFCSADDESFMTCAKDSDGCVYASGTTACSNGACYGSPGAAACCVNGCATEGTICSDNQEGTCEPDSNGCLQAETVPCGTEVPVCQTGTNACGCNGDADCEGNTSGISCLPDPAGSGTSLCGCETSSDCGKDGCCGVQVEGANAISCYGNSDTVGSFTCVNGVWQS